MLVYSLHALDTKSAASTSLTDFVSSLAATLNHVSLFGDAAGEQLIKKAHDGENMDKIARILDKSGVSYVRFMRSLLSCYSRYVLKGNSPTVLLAAIQFLFGTNVRFADTEALHAAACMLRAELITEWEPTTQDEICELVMVAGVDIFQYTLVNTTALLNKQCPMSLRVLDALTKSKDGKWPFLEIEVGPAANIK